MALVSTCIEELNTAVRCCVCLQNHAPSNRMLKCCYHPICTVCLRRIMNPPPPPGSNRAPPPRCPMCQTEDPTTFSPTLLDTIATVLDAHNNNRYLGRPVHSFILDMIMLREVFPIFATQLVNRNEVWLDGRDVEYFYLLNALHNTAVGRVITLDTRDVLAFGKVFFRYIVSAEWSCSDVANFARFCADHSADGTFVAAAAMPTDVQLPDSVRLNSSTSRELITSWVIPFIRNRQRETGAKLLKNFGLPAAAARAATSDWGPCHVVECAIKADLSCEYHHLLKMEEEGRSGQSSYWVFCTYCPEKVPYGTIAQHLGEKHPGQFPEKCMRCDAPLTGPRPLPKGHDKECPLRISPAVSHSLANQGRLRAAPLVLAIPPPNVPLHVRRAKFTVHPEGTQVRLTLVAEP